VSSAAGRAARAGGPWLAERVAAGAAAGLVGGLAFGTAMAELGMLETIASLVRAEGAVVGFAVHMAVAAIVGAGFGVLVAPHGAGAGETVLWGLAYGTLWWFLGPFTLLPLLLGEPLAWTVATAQAQFPSLLGHLTYGATTGLALVAIRWRAQAADGAPRVTAGGLTRGLLAGVVAAWLLEAAVAPQREPLATSAAMGRQPEAVALVATGLLGAAVGTGYALLYPRPPDGAGAGLVRGTVYGFVWWVLAGLTLLPALDGAGLAWSAVRARDAFATLPGYLLLGAGVALGYQWLGALGRLLFGDHPGRDNEQSAGTRGLRAVGQGALAGVVGGLAFTVVMVQVGVLGTIARLVGARSATTGVAVHLLISVLIGGCYGLLFRRQSDTVGSALGWGVGYGFFWWVLGGITLLPVWLGGEPAWTAAAAASTFPSLVGHLAYGAVLGVVFHLLEARSTPWWVSRTELQEARVARRREQLRSSAPAVWVLVVVIALTIPIVLGQGGTP
jgi:uncharacterized membrane protein YagU involved in acid resistance